MKNVLIIGSCVSRDAFDIFGPTDGFEISDYFARSALGSAFADKPFTGVSLDCIASKFQRRMVQIDIEKSLVNFIRQSKSDLILLDMIDERFSLYENSFGEICTLSNELLSSGYRPNPDRGHLIPSGSDEFFQRWLAGWHRLLNIIDDLKSLSKLRINHVFWADSLDSGNDFQPSYPPEKIRAANDFLGILYAQTTLDLPQQQIIKFDKSVFIGAEDHRWGKSPFHYVTRVYKQMIEKLSADHSNPINLEKSNFVLQQSELTSAMRWFEFNVPERSPLILQVVIAGTSGVSERKALISIDFGKPQLNPLPGFGISHDPGVGMYRYLNTGVGCHSTSISLSIPDGCRCFRFGIRSWWSEGPITLESLDLRVASSSRPLALVSVDVEALPNRAETAHVDRLIYGRFGDGVTAGIERICDIFDQYGIKGTFFVDYSTTPIHGEAGIFRAAEFIARRGHDVQLHLHSEVLVRKFGWPYDLTRMPSFDVLDRSTAQRCLEFGVAQYRKNLGKLPTIFRPGGMKHSQVLYEALGDMGIKVASAMYRRFHDNLWPSVQDTPTLLLENGVIEVPLDIALDPLVNWTPFDSKTKRICSSRALFRTVSLLLHSTSLMFRPRDSESDGLFTGFHEPYERILCGYLNTLAENFEFVTYRDFLSRNPPTKDLSFDCLYSKHVIDADSSVLVMDKGHGLALVKTQSARVRAATYRIKPFWKRTNIVDINKHLPPTNVPVRLSPSQRLEIIHTDEFDSVGNNGLGYVLNGVKAHLLRNRASLPRADIFEAMRNTIFEKHPLVENIVAESVLDDALIDGYQSKREVRRTYVLDMPADFQAYRKSIISAQLRYDIEREERRMKESFSGICFLVMRGADVTQERFFQAAALITSHLSRKTNRQFDDYGASWPQYVESGAVATLEADGHIYAAALCLFYGKECYFMAAGHDELITKLSLGKILLFRLIEDLIAKGISRLHLGGGNFGYKSRYGAVEHSLYSFEFLRPSLKSIQERIKIALSLGERVPVIESDIGASLEVVLGSDFEKCLGIDFERIVNPDEIGLDRTASRYQATMRETFFSLMASVDIDQDRIFVDIGCGKGKILYYASQLGYRKCIGIELAVPLLAQAKANLEVMKLDAEIELWERNAAFIEPEELAVGDVFYLYNPFGESIVDAFLKSLVQSQRISPRLIKIIYCNARYLEPFERHGLKIVKYLEQGSTGWRFDNSVIFEHSE